MIRSDRFQDGELLGLFTFFCLAFGIPWAGWVAFRLTPDPGPRFETLAMFWLPASCSLAGFVAATVEGGKKRLYEFSRRVFGYRISPLIWALAIVLPLAAGAITFVTHLPDLWPGKPIALARLGSFVTFANFWTGPISEEFGWRGYLSNRLQRHMPPVLAGLVIGPIWSLWHVPLFYDGPFAHFDSALKFIATTTAWSVTLSLLVELARGSVLPSVLAHWTINNQVFLFALLLPAVPHDRLPGGWPFCCASILIATAAVLVFPRLLPESSPRAALA